MYYYLFWLCCHPAPVLFRFCFCLLFLPSCLFLGLRPALPPEPELDDPDLQQRERLQRALRAAREHADEWPHGLPGRRALLGALDGRRQQKVLLRRALRAAVEVQRPRVELVVPDLRRRRCPGAKNIERRRTNRLLRVEDGHVEHLVALERAVLLRALVVLGVGLGKERELEEQGLPLPYTAEEAREYSADIWKVFVQTR